MIWLASNLSVVPLDKVIESFPSSLSETTWADWFWFLIFFFLGSPLMTKIWKAEKKGLKEVISIIVLILFFFGGWTLVVYLTR